MKSLVLTFGIAVSIFWPALASAKITVQKSKRGGAYLMTAKGARSLKRIARERTYRAPDGSYYKVTPTVEGTLNIEREWVFGQGRTQAKAIWVYDRAGNLRGYSQATGRIEKGHALRSRGWDRQRGKMDWKLFTTGDPSFGIYTHGLNSAGPLKESIVVSKLDGYYKRFNMRNGTVVEEGTLSAPDRAILSRMMNR